MKNNIKIKNKSNASVWLLSIAAAGVITMIPDLAAAGPLDGPLCTITEWFSGGTGKAIATIAIIFLGIAAFFGKVTWGLALMFAVGIFAIFGSADIVNAIGDDDGSVGAESCKGTTPAA